MFTLSTDGLSESLGRYWWLFVLRGVLAIVFGIIAWAWPGLTLATLIWLAGFWLVFDGGFAIGGAIANRKQLESVWPHVLVGIAAIIGGVFIMAWPDFTAVWLIVTIGVFAIWAGLLEIIDAIRLRKIIDNEWSMGLLGVLNILFGLIMVLFPGAGALSLIWLIGIYAILIGATEIVFGFKARSLQ